MKTPDYIIISPVRNEAKYLPDTIASVMGQTLKPKLWVIVDDGSTDETPRILAEAAQKHSEIRPVRRADRGFRKSGGGVVEAFNDGRKEIGDTPWDFIVKLDGDLSFDPDYFEKCYAHFSTDPKLGIGGGTICGRVDGQLVEESPGDPRFHVRGATKIYSRACWEAIGGLVSAPGWDTIDEIKANMLGWTTYSFAELKLLHHRYAGNADGQWKNWIKNGRANYNTGYHPLFMFVKAVTRLAKRPYGIASVGLLTGFVGCYLKGQPKHVEPEVERYLRDQQMRRLFFKKSIWS